MEQIKNAVDNVLEDLEGFTFTEAMYILADVKSKIEKDTNRNKKRR